jgi:hypothetical protein
MIQHDDLHRLIWICGIIGTVGAAGGVCYGAIRWMSAVYGKGCDLVKDIGRIHEVAIISDQTARQVADVKLAVDIIQTNHLAHLQSGIEEIARSNVNIEANTKDIRDGIIKLVDRERPL